MDIPCLKKSTRSREYFTYNDMQHAAVVKSYLIEGKTHRELDAEILRLNPDYSRGWQSMGILHYLGLKGDFKGLFEKQMVSEVISELQVSKNDDYSEIIDLLSGVSETEEKQIYEDIVNEMTEVYEVQEEGKKIKYYTTRYERNTQNRKAAIKIHGTKCQACGFDFQNVYGDRGKDYIEVHHVVPLAHKDEIVKVDPAKDLIVVCSNCHRMIHRKKNEVLTLDELRDIIASCK